MYIRHIMVLERVRLAPSDLNWWLARVSSLVKSCQGQATQRITG